MMAGPSVFTWVVSFERTLLLAITLEYGRVQVQRVAVGSWRQTLHLPFRHWFVEALHLAHAESAKQIADRIVGGKSVHAQQRMQSSIAPQQTGVSETPGAQQHRYQERRERDTWIDMIR